MLLLFLIAGRVAGEVDEKEPLVVHTDSCFTTPDHHKEPLAASPLTAPVTLQAKSWQELINSPSSITTDK